MKTYIPELKNGPDYPRDRTQYRITSVEEAKAFLRELHDNDEAYHPEDDAEDNENEDIRLEADALNKCMEDIYALPGVPGDDFDPCGYLIDLKKGIPQYEEATGHKVKCLVTGEERKPAEKIYGTEGDALYSIARKDGNIVYLSISNDGDWVCLCGNMQPAATSLENKEFQQFIEATFEI